MTRATLLLSTLLAALSMGAVAQDTMGTGSTTGQDSGTKTFSELDANSDGSLDEEEVKNSGSAQSFDDLDANSDGKVDRDEYTQSQSQSQ